MITAPDGTMYRAADAHVHIYKEKIAAKASQVIGDFYHADGYNFEMWEPDPAPEVLLRKGKEIGIDRYAVFSAATAARQVDSINRFIADECARHPEFVGLGTAHPDAIDPTLPDGRDCEALVEQIAALGLKGMKLHPDMQQFNIDDPRMMPLYRAAAQAGLVVLFHVGDERHSFSDPVRLDAMRHTWAVAVFGIGAPLRSRLQCWRGQILPLTQVACWRGRLLTMFVSLLGSWGLTALCGRAITPCGRRPRSSNFCWVWAIRRQITSGCYTTILRGSIGSMTV